jgi:Na+-driven multidrug efflux pump
MESSIKKSTTAIKEGPYNKITDEQQGEDKDIAYQSLGSKTPFKTILITSGGPFLAELVGAAYGILDTFWIAKFAEKDGNAAMTLVSLMDTIIRAFGALMSSAASSQLSYLRGEKKENEIPQVFSDLFRFSILLGIICPCCLYPLIKPLLNFFNAEGQVRQFSIDYLVPAVFGSICTIMNLFLCGCLQAEGRSTLYGINQMTSFILNMALFDPLFMGAFKLKMKGAAYSTICSDGLMMLVFGILFLIGKFDTKMTLKNFLSRPIRESLGALKVGLTQFISHICFSLPSFFSRKYIEIGATKMGKYTEILAALNPVMRMWYLPGSYAVALSVCVLPAMSYAKGANNNKRVKSLLKWGIIMSIIWCAITEALIICFGNYIAMIFGKDEEFIKLTWKMLIITYSAAFLMGVEMICASFLQSLKYATLAIVLSILTRFLPVPMFGSIFFFTNPSRDVFRTLLMYPASDIFSCIVGLIVIIYPYRKLKDDDAMNRPLITDSASATMYNADIF